MKRILTSENYLSVLLVVLSLLVTSCLHTHRNGFEDDRPKVTINSVDFIPEGGVADYNVRCRDGYSLTFDNVKWYKPQIEINNSLPGRLKIRYWVQSEGDFFSDATLGWFDVTFNAGDVTPSSILHYNGNPNYPNPSGSPDVPNGKLPIGAPPSTANRGFWLGCTKKCFLRGNDNKIGANYDKVYIREAQILEKDESFRLDSNREKESPHRQVWCSTSL